MATVKDTMDEAARECSLTPPTSWISNMSTSFMEMKQFLNDTVDELLERVDWPDPIAKDIIITGDGSEEYDLPSDFKRLTRDPLTVYETTTTRRAGVPINTNGDWTYIKDIGSAGGSRYYRIAGDEEDGFTISFFRNPSSSDSITVSYISKDWLKISGTAGDTWSDISAALLLPKRLIKMGVIWRFRRRKGLPYADRMNEYEAVMARMRNDARVIRSVDMTGGGSMRSPFDIPVPDFIPQS
jgi:hypothetical protein